MKKTLTIAIGVVIGYALCYFQSKESVVNEECVELYNQLSKEDFKNGFGELDSERILYIDVGIDYIPYELIGVFEKLSGVKTIVDIFDSNEILEAKLLAGGSQYDIVFPTAWPNFSRQLGAGIYQKLDKSRINLDIFDEDIMERLARYDKGNLYGVPYQFGISGIGINADVVKSLVGNAPVDSYAILFDPFYAEKLSKYRISLYESPDELFPALLAYLGLDPETENADDVKKAAEQLEKIRPYISKFTSYGFEDLGTENACATLGTSGDILKSASTNPKLNIKFFFPKEGASLWVDVAAIPKNAKHVKNAYAFMKFIFNPKVIAYVTNVTLRANAVVAANEFVDEKLTKNPDVYPTEEIRANCYTEVPCSPGIEALKTRLLTIIKSMDIVPGKNAPKEPQKKLQTSQTVKPLKKQTKNEKNQNEVDNEPAKN